MDRAWIEYLRAQAELGGSEIFLDSPLARPAVTASAAIATPRSATAARTREEEHPERAGSGGGFSSIPIAHPAPLPAVEKHEFESCASLTEFHELIRQHALYRGHRVALGQGPLNPQAMLVGYMISAEDLRSGSFYSGEAAELLRKILDAVRIPRNLCYATHLIKTPQGADPLPRQILQYRRMLETEVRLVKPRLILLLGEAVLRAIVGKSCSMQSHGGSAMQLQGYPMTAIYDPETLLAQPQLKVITWKSHIPKSGYFDLRPAGGS